MRPDHGVPFAQVGCRHRPGSRRHHGHPRALRRGRDGRSEGGHRRRGHAWLDRQLSRGRGPGVRRGQEVHPQRRQGLQPERDVVEGQGRGGRGVRAHLSRPWQRLAQPVHLRPRLHDQGRDGAQLVGRQWRLQQQVLRRAVHGTARARAGRDRAPPPPVLRLGQLRAGWCGAERLGRPPARRQLRHGLPEGRRRGGHRRRPLERRVLSQADLHDPPVHRGHVADDAEQSRQRRVVPVGANAGRDRLPGSQHPDVRVLSIARDRDRRRHDRRGRVGRLRRHGR